MIHSMSGGVISENGRYTFVKVELDGTPQWYLSSSSSVKAGDRVLLPCGYLTREAVVVKVEEADAQCAPVPMKRIKEILKVL